MSEGRMMGSCRRFSEYRSMSPFFHFNRYICQVPNAKLVIGMATRISIVPMKSAGAEKGGFGGAGGGTEENADDAQFATAGSVDVGEVTAARIPCWFHGL